MKALLNLTWLFLLVNAEFIEFELTAKENFEVCPDGYDVDFALCLAAAHDVAGTVMDLKNVLIIGTWDFAPCGCSIHRNHFVHFKHPSGGNCSAADQESQLLCRKQQVSRTLRQIKAPRHVSNYKLEKGGVASRCPGGKEISKTSCFAAAHEVGKLHGMELLNFLNDGTFDNSSPCGCFIYNDHWVNYKDPAHGNCLPDPNSNLVCFKEEFPLNFKN